MTVPAMATTQAASLARVPHPQGVRHFESPTAVPPVAPNVGGNRRAPRRCSPSRSYESARPVDRRIRSRMNARICAHDSSRHDECVLGRNDVPHFVTFFKDVLQMSMYNTLRIDHGARRCLFRAVKRKIQINE